MFSGFASTGLGRGDASTPERRSTTDTDRSETTAGPCAGLNGRLSTPASRIWQASGRSMTTAARLAAALLVQCGTAQASDLGERIAETLCYPPSTTVMQLSSDEEAVYQATKRIDGSHRDTEGPDARAWFSKTSTGAACRRPANWQLTLFFCAVVSHADGVLTKARPRLCS